MSRQPASSKRPVRQRKQLAPGGRIQLPAGLGRPPPTEYHGL